MTGKYYNRFIDSELFVCKDEENRKPLYAIGNINNHFRACKS